MKPTALADSKPSEQPGAKKRALGRRNAPIECGRRKSGETYRHRENSHHLVLILFRRFGIKTEFHCMEMHLIRVMRLTGLLILLIGQKAGLITLQVHMLFCVLFMP